MLAFPTHEVAVTAATLEEQARSWISLIGRYSDVRQQVAYYERFVAMFRFFAAWQILALMKCDRGIWHCAASGPESCDGLKIAANTLVHAATLVSRNLRDFEKVPGLRVENWLP